MVIREKFHYIQNLFEMDDIDFLDSLISQVDQKVDTLKRVRNQQKESF